MYTTLNFCLDLNRSTNKKAYVPCIVNMYSMWERTKRMKKKRSFNLFLICENYIHFVVFFFLCMDVSSWITKFSSNPLWIFSLLYRNLHTHTQLCVQIVYTYICIISLGFSYFILCTWSFFGTELLLGVWCVVCVVILLKNENICLSSRDERRDGKANESKDDNCF